MRTEIILVRKERDGGSVVISVHDYFVPIEFEDMIIGKNGKPLHIVAKEFDCTSGTIRLYVEE